MPELESGLSEPACSNPKVALKSSVGLVVSEPGCLRVLDMDPKVALRSGVGSVVSEPGCLRVLDRVTEVMVGCDSGALVSKIHSFYCIYIHVHVQNIRKSGSYYQHCVNVLIVSLLLKACKYLFHRYMLSVLGNLRIRLMGSLSSSSHIGRFLRLVALKMMHMTIRVKHKTHFQTIWQTPEFVFSNVVNTYIPIKMRVLISTLIMFVLHVYCFVLTWYLKPRLLRLQTHPESLP